MHEVKSVRDKMKSASAPPSRGVRVFPRFHFPQRLRQGKSRTLKVRNSTALAEQPPQAQFLSSKIGHNACHFFFFGVPHLQKRLFPAVSTVVTNIDFPAHLHKLVTQVLPLWSLDACVDVAKHVARNLHFHERWLNICWLQH